MWQKRDQNSRPKEGKDETLSGKDNTSGENAAASNTYVAGVPNVEAESRWCGSNPSSAK